MSYVTARTSSRPASTLRDVHHGDIEKLGHDKAMHGTAVELPVQQRRAEPAHAARRAVELRGVACGDIAIYAQDQWTIDRLTLNLGVRFNDAKASTPEQVLGAGYFVPERRFAPLDNVPHYRNLSPRLGVAYDLFGTGRTALKASIGHYPDDRHGVVGNPSTNLTRKTNRTWNDANRNFVPDCDLLNPAANGECGAWSDLNFGKPQAGTRYADGCARRASTRSSTTGRASVSVQHELTPGVGLNVGYFRTWYGGIPASTDNLAVDAGDYDSTASRRRPTRRLPDSGEQLCGLYDVKPAVFGQVDNLRDPASDFGEQTQVYNGVDVTLNARFGQGGSSRAA